MSKRRLTEGEEEEKKSDYEGKTQQSKIIKKEDVDPLQLEAFKTNETPAEQEDVGELTDAQPLQLEVFKTNETPVKDVIGFTPLPNSVPVPSNNFSAYVNMHGGYYIDTHLQTYTFKSKTIRQITHIAPLGTSSWSTYPLSSLMLHLIFILRVDPIVASWFVYTQKFNSTITDDEDGDIPFFTVLDETYQYYNNLSGTTWLNKISRYDLPETIKRKIINDKDGSIKSKDNPNYGYKYYNPPDLIDEPETYTQWTISEPAKEFIGYCYEMNRGYFLLDDYVKTFSAVMIFTLKKIVEYISSVVDGGMDAFSEIEERVIENRSVTVKYKRGFNITQCKYFIAYMVVSKIGIPPIFTPEKKIPTEYKLKILEILKINIDPTTSRVLPNIHPFLIKTVDFTVPGAFVQTMPYLRKNKDGKDIRVLLTRDSTNINALVGEKSDVIINERGEKRNIPKKKTLLKRRDSFSMIPFSGTLARGPTENEIKFELKEDNLDAEHIHQDSKEFFKLAVFQHYESDLDKFINGNKKSVTNIIFQNCSALLSNEVVVTKEIALAFIKKIKTTNLGRGSRITSNKSRKKYKKNTIKKSKRKRRKTMRK